ncbi:MAG: beta-galactosidase, partial [Chloroflexi bacterium]|nr:beta-galactosidase [Chloroflexota bacterium]
MMYYGADYYPEHWPQERWETDARLMEEAGINLVRMGEFAWSLYEPQEGIYHWEWLEQAIATLAAHGIHTVLGTPTATPPAWMCQAYPEIMVCERNGRRVTFGERRQYCPTNAVYRQLSRRIASAMAERFGSNPHVVAWQIDNEFAGHHPRCYCPDCQRAFQNWLRAKYGTLEELNGAWGAHFWSHDYTNWAQIPLPVDSNGVSNPCLELDFYRFASDQWVGFQHNQVEALRKIVPAHQRITHNFMGYNFQEINYFDLARELDFVAWDNYPIFQASDPAHIALNHAAMRGLKNQPFWVMEEQSGPSGWQVMSRQPRPGQIRLWAYQAIAHGADAIVYFRWRTCQFNTEEYWHGILEHHGQPRRRYYEVQRMGQEIARIGDRLSGAMPPKAAAMILSYGDIYALRLQPGAQGLSYNELFGSY